MESRRPKAEERTGGGGADLGWASTTKKSTKIDLPIRFDPKVD